MGRETHDGGRTDAVVAWGRWRSCRNTKSGPARLGRVGAWCCGWWSMRLRSGHYRHPLHPPWHRRTRRRAGRGREFYAQIAQRIAKALAAQLRHAIRQRNKRAVFNFAQALEAVCGPLAVRLEWHRGLLAAIGAYGFKHFPFVRVGSPSHASAAPARRRSFLSAAAPAHNPRLHFLAGPRVQYTGVFYNFFASR